MKTTIALSLTVLICLFSGIASASASDAPAKGSHTLPVLVKVNTKGDVTDIQPAYKVRPTFKHLLKDTIVKMVTKPAMRNGKPVESQFVITLAVLTSDGAKDHAGTTFKYLAVKPLPPGNWHWVHDAEDRLALSSQTTQTMIKYPLTDMQRKANALNQAAMNERYRPGSSR